MPLNRYFYWCPGPDSNRHFRYRKTDFKSVASTNFATRAHRGASAIHRARSTLSHTPARGRGPARAGHGCCGRGRRLARIPVAGPATGSPAQSGHRRRGASDDAPFSRARATLDLGAPCARKGDDPQTNGNAPSVREGSGPSGSGSCAEPAPGRSRGRRIVKTVPSACVEVTTIVPP